VLWRFIRKDLLRHARDPVALILWAAIPLAVAILMRAAFGGDEQIPQATLVIADQDDSLVSQLLAAAFDAGPLQELIHTEQADSARAVELAQGGDVSAALFIPRGFGNRYLEGGTPTLTLLRNPSQTILPAIVEETIAVLAEGGFYVRELFGDPIRTMRSLSASDSGSVTAREISSGIQAPMERVAPYLFPPVLTVAAMAEPFVSSGTVASKPDASEGNVEQNPSNASAAPVSDEPPGFLEIFFPGILTMSMLFLGQALAVDIWAEHKLGTFRRLHVTPKGVGGLVLGKVIAGTLIFWLIFELLLLLGRYAFQIDLERIHLAAIYSAMCGFGVLAALHFIMVLPRSENGGTILGSLVVMPLVFLGGSFFPFETLSPTMRAIGTATPNGQILVQIKRIVSGGPLDAAVWITPLIAIGLGLVFTMLAARGARRRFLGAS
jgi:ABC-type multidrug transport system permease subunit